MTNFLAGILLGVTGTVGVALLMELTRKQKQAPCYTREGRVNEWPVELLN